MANLISGNTSGSTYEHDGISDTILDSVAVSGEGRSWLNGNLLVSVNASKLVREYNGFSTSILQTIIFTEFTWAITHDDTNLIASDGNADNINRYVGLSNTLDTGFSAVNIYGLQWHTDGNLYSVSISGTDNLKKHDGFSSSILDSVTLPVFQSGLTLSGSNIVGCNSSSQTITQYVGFSNTVDFSFSSPDTTPSGLVLRGLDGFIPIIMI